MKKRNLFSELMEGFDALEGQRTGKATLKTLRVLRKEPIKITCEEVANLRAELNVSQAVFALKMRTKVRTLENWEQGRSKPNPQASILLKLVQKHPELLDEIAAL